MGDDMTGPTDAPVPSAIEARQRANQCNGDADPAAWGRACCSRCICSDEATGRKSFRDELREQAVLARPSKTPRPYWFDRATAAENRLAAVEAENARLREDNRLLALAWKGITPDRNTQTEAEADATEEVIYATARRALSGDEQRAGGGR